MSILLYIKANPKKNEDSWSYKMSEFFIGKYRSWHPEDTITELNLYDNPPEYLYQNVPPNERKVDFKNLKHDPQYVDQFIKSDKYVIAAPMWNFSVPAILKSYMDQIAVFGKTYEYIPDKGAVSLLKNKKMLTLVAMGGKYIGTNADFCTPFLKQFFNIFLGIENYQNITFEGTSKYTKEELAEILKRKEGSFSEILKNF